MLVAALLRQSDRGHERSPSQRDLTLPPYPFLENELTSPHNNVKGASRGDDATHGCPFTPGDQEIVDGIVLHTVASVYRTRWAPRMQRPRRERWRALPRRHPRGERRHPHRRRRPCASSRPLAPLPRSPDDVRLQLRRCELRPQPLWRVQQPLRVGHVQQRIVHVGHPHLRPATGDVRCQLRRRELRPQPLWCVRASLRCRANMCWRQLRRGHPHLLATATVVCGALCRREFRPRPLRRVQQPLPLGPGVHLGALQRRIDLFSTTADVRRELRRRPERPQPLRCMQQPLLRRANLFRRTVHGRLDDRRHGGRALPPQQRLPGRCLHLGRGRVERRLLHLCLSFQCDAG